MSSRCCFWDTLYLIVFEMCMCVEKVHRPWQDTVITSTKKLLSDKIIILKNVNIVVLAVRDYVVIFFISLKYAGMEI